MSGLRRFILGVSLRLKNQAPVAARLGEDGYIGAHKHSFAQFLVDFLGTYALFD